MYQAGSIDSVQPPGTKHCLRGAFRCAKVVKSIEAQARRYSEFVENHKPTKSCKGLVPHASSLAFSWDLGCDIM